MERLIEHSKADLKEADNKNAMTEQRIAKGLQSELRGKILKSAVYSLDAVS